MAAAHQQIPGPISAPPLRDSMRASATNIETSGADQLPWYPKSVLLVVAALVLVLVIVRPLREWAFTTDIRNLVAFHLVRFVGFYFLLLYSLHELPYNFAVLGGSGDIAVAILALAVIFLFYKSKAAVVLWNLLGLADIIGVAVTAARDEMAIPGSMHRLDHFPLILLPTFIVPLIIVTHGLMLVRLLRPVRIR